MTSTDENIPHEIQQFFRDERPWGTDRNLHQVYVKNFPRIRDSETLTDDPEFTLDTSIIPIPHSLNPLSMPLKIFFIDKPMHSR